jgi:2-methylcitrate dehydratase PrpD
MDCTRRLARVIVPVVTVAARIAEFLVKARLDDCPREGLELVRRAALDTIGVMLAGAGEPAARIMREVARTEGGTPVCTVLGTNLRTSTTWAALANGVAGHAHDFDDTNFALMGHPSVPLWAAVLAAAEAAMADGQALVLGYLVGFEVSAAVGGALNPSHYQRGWHATSSIGTLGCAAAAARVFGLSPEQVRHAMGLAASLASGVKENFGTMTKPYHAGHAARNGVVAALMAREGFTASENALEGRQGWLAASGDGAAREALAGALDQLGQRWLLVETGIAVKPYPSCALTHAAIDALLGLRAEHAIRPSDVVDVEIGVNRVTPDVLIHPTPTTALERKFSMQFCAAAALAEGRVDFASFEDGDVRNPDVRALMPRVRLVVDSALPDGLTEHAWSRVSLRLRDGRTLDAPPRGATGHPDRPLTPEALRAKFLACAATAIAADDAASIADQIEHLEEIPDVRALTARLVTDRD